MKSIVISLVLILSTQVHAQSVRDSLNQRLATIAQSSELPGFAVSIVSKDKILYSNGFGYADRERKIPFTSETVQNIGSITKTLIGFATMKLVEEGKLSLEDPINDYLPFSVVNPSFPNQPITVRQLATHTSSLTDGADDMVIEKTYLFTGEINFQEEELPEDYYPYFRIYQQNESMSMEQYLYDVYHVKGKFYAKTNFLEQPPGTAYRYSNIGATLLALIIEKISGESFSDYTQKILLAPLELESTYWNLENVPKDKMITHYLSNGLRIPPYELITYPDGGLLTNVTDFSYYLMDMIKGLAGEGQLLSKEGYEELMSNQLTIENFPNGNFEVTKGLMWNVNREEDNISMNGSDPGILTYTLFTTAGNLGIVIFMNTNIDDNESIEDAFNAIRGTLFQNAGALLKE
ncbi:MAG: serine hydrolase domain-containing protein [Bacteroidota bacterium]